MGWRNGFKRRGGVLTAALLLALLALPAGAQVQKRRYSSLDDLAFSRPELRVQAEAVSLEELRLAAKETSAPLAAAVDGLARRADGPWIALVDRATGRPVLLEGKGIPWIPGTANDLRPSDLGLKGAEIPLSAAEGLARAFLDEHPGLFGVDGRNLVLNREASGPIGDFLYFVDFDWTYHGLPVEDAHIVFRLNHGNLVQMGAEGISDAIRELDPAPALSPETAAETGGKPREGLLRNVRRGGKGLKERSVYSSVLRVKGGKTG